MRFFNASRLRDRTARRIDDVAVQACAARALQHECSGFAARPTTPGMGASCPSRWPSSCWSWCASTSRCATSDGLLLALQHVEAAFQRASMHVGDLPFLALGEGAKASVHVSRHAHDEGRAHDLGSPHGVAPG
jgi:hypothetical protein